GPESLASARVTRDDRTAHNGMRTVVWEQQLQGIAVFEAILISHTTRNDELINLTAQFLPDAARAATAAAPAITARKAVALAAANVGVTVAEENITATTAVEATPEQRQKFKAPGLKGEADAKLIWLPMDRKTVRLCWDVVVMSRKRGEMFRL